MTRPSSFENYYTTLPSTLMIINVFFMSLSSCHIFNHQVLSFLFSKCHCTHFPFKFETLRPDKDSYCLTVECRMSLTVLSNFPSWVSPQTLPPSSLATVYPVHSRNSLLGARIRLSTRPPIHVTPTHARSTSKLPAPRRLPLSPPGWTHTRLPSAHSPHVQLGEAALHHSLLCPDLTRTPGHRPDQTARC